jgi:O-glycosyl hydrolase
VVRRGARVIASHGEPKGVDHVAFQNPDGSFALVLTNRGDQQAVQCRMGRQACDVTLDSGSVTTLVW